jgi:hypothetical protein
MALEGPQALKDIISIMNIRGCGSGGKEAMYFAEVAVAF